MNPAPDADRHSVGAENFEWIVDKVAKLALKKAAEYTGEPMAGAALVPLSSGLTAPTQTTVAAAAKLPAKKAAAKKAAAKSAAK